MHWAHPAHFDRHVSVFLSIGLGGYQNHDFDLYRAIGIGAVQANMAVFGAEQVREHKATTRFFDYYYGAVNTGGLVAFAAVAYLQLKSYFIGYLVPGGLLVLAFICFLAGYKTYIYVRPFDSVVTNFFPVFFNACRTWRRYGHHNIQAENHRAFSSETSLLKSDRISNDSLSFNASVPTWSFLDYAKIANKGRFIDREVDDIKSLRRVVVVFLLLIPYWLLYVQVRMIKIIDIVFNHLFPTRSKQRLLSKVLIWNFQQVSKRCLSFGFLLEINWSS